MIDEKAFHPVALLCTDGAPHPPEKWARVFADQIVQVEDGASNYRRAMGLDLHAAIEKAAHRVVEGAQQAERDACRSEGLARLDRDLTDAERFVDLLVGDVLFEAAQSPFAAHFQAEQVKTYLRNLSIRTLSTVLFIERSWFADAHPDASETQAFRRRWNAD